MQDLMDQGFRVEGLGFRAEGFGKWDWVFSPKAQKPNPKT